MNDDMTNWEKVKQLRSETQLSISKVKLALEAHHWNMDEARKDLLSQTGKDAAGREMPAGRVATYQHHNNQLGAIVRVRCATDFTANNETFGKFCTLLAQQVAAMGSEDILAQVWMFGEVDRTVQEELNSLSAQTGEPIKIDHVLQLTI